MARKTGGGNGKAKAAKNDAASGSGDGLVTAQVAAQLLGIKSPSNFRYHVRKGRIKPVTEVTIGKMRIPYYDPKDVAKLKVEIATNKKNGSGGRPRFSDMNA